MRIRNSFIIFFVIIVGALFASIIVDASATDGTIDPTHRYAWTENLGWIDFGSAGGNIHVLDDTLTGYAWGENVGWISLNCSNTSSCGAVNYKVSNNSEGVLTGYAWGENVGWIDFSPENGGVAINSEGYFHGYAWGENVGWVVFNCSTTNSCATVDYKIRTDWRPISARNNGGGGGGSSPPPIDTTPPSDITDLVAVDTGFGGEIRLNWTNPSDSDLVQVRLYRSDTDENFIPFAENQIAVISGQPGAFIEYLDAGLINGHIYYYKVLPEDVFGNIKSDSAYSVSVIPTLSNSVKRVDIKGVPILEGDLIRGPDGIKVYVVNHFGYKRHILNPEIFGMYGHLSWSNIKEVSKDVLSSYPISSVFTALGDYRMYLIEKNTETGEAIKRHLNMTPQDFEALGYTWKQVFIINVLEKEHYKTGEDIIIK